MQVSLKQLPPKPQPGSKVEKIPGLTPVCLIGFHRLSKVTPLVHFYIYTSNFA